MDAISFVLGVKSAQLRSSQLRDLVYRGRRLAKNGITNGVDGGSVVDAEGEDDDVNQQQEEQEGEGEDEGEGTAKKAWVLAVYVDAEGTEWKFQRT